MRDPCRLSVVLVALLALSGPGYSTPAAVCSSLSLNLVAFNGFCNPDCGGVKTVSGSGKDSQSATLETLNATATASVDGHTVNGSESWTASFTNASQGTVTLNSLSISSGGGGGVGFGDVYFNYTGGFSGNGGFGVNNGFYYTFIADASGKLTVKSRGTYAGLPVDGTDGVWLAQGWVPTTYFPADGGAIFSNPGNVQAQQFSVVAGTVYTLGIFDMSNCWGAAACGIQHTAQFTFSMPSGSSTTPSPGLPATCGAGVTPGGIVPLDSPTNTIAPGEWVSIYGTNLATATATWKGDFPTSLDGTSVTIDGKAAYLAFVSPTQINLQAPDDTITGTVPVVVSSALGTAAGNATLAPFAPSFFLLDSQHVSGIILRSDGSGAYGGGTYDILGPTGSQLGYPTVAAKAGDIVELFATGLGPTNPSVAAGSAFSSAAPTANPVSVLINGTSVSPAFAGLSSAGLYQINLTVPTGLGTGDVPLQLSVGGVPAQSGVVVSLQ